MFKSDSGYSPQGLICCVLRGPVVVGVQMPLARKQLAYRILLADVGIMGIRR